MTEFVEFCREYGVYILTFVCFIIEIIFIFIKRKPKTLDDFVSVVNEIRLMVPYFVSMVETPGNGEIKKGAVIKVALDSISKKIGRDLTLKERDIVSGLLDKDIEAVLTAPQKKELLNEK